MRKTSSCKKYVFTDDFGSTYCLYNAEKSIQFFYTKVDLYPSCCGIWVIHGFQGSPPDDAVDEYAEWMVNKGAFAKNALSYNRPKYIEACFASTQQALYYEEGEKPQFEQESFMNALIKLGFKEIETFVNPNTQRIIKHLRYETSYKTRSD